MSGIAEEKFQRVMALVSMFTPDAVDGSKTRRFLAKKKHTFAGVLKAIANCSPFFEGTPVSEDVVASCQKVVRDEIAGRPDAPSKTEAILQLIDAVLRSIHRIRPNIVVDSPSSDYTLGDVEAALLMANSDPDLLIGYFDQEVLQDVKRANPALASADYSYPSAIIAYVDAINTRITGDSYNSKRDRYDNPDVKTRCEYPQVSMGSDATMREGSRRATLTLYTDSGPDTEQEVRLEFRDLGDSFGAFLPRVHGVQPYPYDMVQWLLTHQSEISVARVRTRVRVPGQELRWSDWSDDLGVQSDDLGVTDWAAAAVASSGLFSCRTKTIVTKHYRTHAGFVDLATAE